MNGVAPIDLPISPNLFTGGDLVLAACKPSKKIGRPRIWPDEDQRTRTNRSSAKWREKRRAYERRYREENPEKCREIQRRYYAKTKRSGFSKWNQQTAARRASIREHWKRLMVRYAARYRSGFITVLFAMVTARRKKSTAVSVANLKSSRVKNRAAAIAAYGGKCRLCGFSDPRALQFDHVHGGGVKELRKHSMKPSYYKTVAKDMTGKYQLLCANCNWIKKRETIGETPIGHPKKGLTKGLRFCLPQWT